MRWALANYGRREMDEDIVEAALPCEGIKSHQT